MSLINPGDGGLRLRCGPGVAPLEVAWLPGLGPGVYAVSLSNGKLCFFSAQGAPRVLPGAVGRADYFAALRGGLGQLCAYARGREVVLARLSLREGGKGVEASECDRMQLPGEVTALRASPDGSMVAIGAGGSLFSVAVALGGDRPRFEGRREYEYFDKDVRVLEFDPHARERGPVLVALDAEGSMGVFDTSAGEEEECLFMASFLFPVSALLPAEEGYWLLVGLAGLALAGREDGEVLWKSLDLLAELGKADLLLPPLAVDGAVHAVSATVDGRTRLSRALVERGPGTSPGASSGSPPGAPRVRFEPALTLLAPDFAAQRPAPGTAASQQRSRAAPAAEDPAGTPHAPCCLARSDAGLVVLTEAGEAIVYQTRPGKR